MSTPDNIPVSDTTIATRITPVMWCPTALAGQPFFYVTLGSDTRLNDQPLAICTYADGSQAVYDARINGYTQLGDARPSPHAIIAPYNAQAWQGLPCTNQDSAKCPFVFVDASKF